MSAIDGLIAEFARLPGIGRKTAQRLTYHLLDQPVEQVNKLADCLTTVAEKVRPCGVCGLPLRHTEDAVHYECMPKPALEDEAD